MKAFQSVPGASPQDETERAQQNSGDKETATVEVGEDTEMGGVPIANGTSSATRRSTESSQSGSSTTPQTSHANTFPCTPGARLPLEDLIGTFDDTARRPAEKEQSPEEQIGWIPNSSSTLLTPNRKRKRARSSSPSCPTTSSQRQETSAFFAGNGTQGEKRTPEADPTADLWRRYGDGKDVGEGLKLPDFSHLIGQASPRPLETPAKNAAFRRWASTGNDWPSSKNKRPRTDGKTSISLWQDGQQQADSGGKSKVATMVEKIQESLATQKLAQSVSKPAVRVEAPSSSNPLPEIAMETFSNAPSASPLQARQQLQQQQQQQRPQPQQPPVRALQANAARPPLAQNNARGNLNLSSDSLLPVNDNKTRQIQPQDTVMPAPLHLQSKAPLPAYRRPAITRAPSASGRQYPMKQPSQPKPAPVPILHTVNVDLDEFGDDAFDLSAEDLDELVSQKPPYQRSLHEIPPHPNPPPQRQNYKPTPPPRQAVVPIDDSDDEFGGDDLDESTLVEAEISATQAYRASQASKPMPVRSR